MPNLQLTSRERDALPFLAALGACVIVLLVASCRHAGVPSAPSTTVREPEPPLDELLSPEERCLKRAGPLRLPAPGQELPESFLANEAVATQVWQCMNPTGEDFEDKLDAFRHADPALRRALARSFLRTENVDCSKEDETSSDCGSPGIAMGDIAPTARPGDPCLDRSLVRWALKHGGLLDADVEALHRNLAALTRLRDPERELPRDVLELAARSSETVRLPLLIEAPAELAAMHLKSLSDAGLVTLARERSLDEAILAVDRTRHRDLILEALSDDALKTETRRALLGYVATLSGDDVVQALTDVARSDDFALSTAAALDLKRRGDARYMPGRQGEGRDTAEALSREICRLGFLPDAREAKNLFREFLPPAGQVTLVDDSPSPSEDGQRSCTRNGPSPCALPSLRDDVEISCRKLACVLQMGNSKVTLTFARAKDKRLYLSRIVRVDLPDDDPC